MIAPLTDTIADKLAANGFGTKGTDIFGGEFPDANSGIAIMHTGASVQNAYMDLRNQPVDFYIRGDAGLTSYDLAHRLYNFLAFLWNWDGTDYYIYSCNPIGGITDLGRDFEGRTIWRFTLSFNYRPHGSIAAMS